MGFSGLVSASQNSSVIPDLAFFSLLLKEQELTRKSKYLNNEQVKNESKENFVKKEIEKDTSQDNL